MRPNTILACALALVFAAWPLHGATDGGIVIPTTNGISETDLNLAAAGLFGVPLRVDYRERNDAFDLNLLGAATGMCPLSGECNACLYRDSNPCKVADRYGADPSICHLPSFLGGDVPADQLCGIGATVDIILSNGSEAVGTLTAFRKRSGTLMLTVTARCGWVILPFTSTAANQTGGSSSSEVMLEGRASYLGSKWPITAPAEAQDDEVELYSCYSTVLKLRGLSSKCQALDLDLNLRLSMQRVDVVMNATSPVCQEAGSVVEAVAHLSMRVPQVRAQAAAVATLTAKAAAVLEAEDGSPSDSSSSSATKEKHNFFSEGVAATTAYSVSVDPRNAKAVEWLQSLTSQSPVISVTNGTEELSFLIGSVRKDARDGLPAANGLGDSEPLLPDSLYLEACGRQSISAVQSAVVAALATKGVTDQDVADIVCLQSPYTDVAASALPPCASRTAVLFNVTLRIPMGPHNTSATTSNLLQSLGFAGTTAQRAEGSTAADPQSLADALVGAQLASPWSCLSTEGQMRMTTKVDLNLQLPKGPGVVEATSLMDSTTTATAPSPEIKPGVTIPGPQGSGAPLTVSDGAKSFSTVVIVAVVVAAVLIAVVVLVAGFAVRSVRRSRAAAKDAASAAAAANATVAALAAARGQYTGGIGSHTAPPPGKLSPYSAKSPSKFKLYGEPSGLGAESSYASTTMYYNACAEMYIQDRQPQRVSAGSDDAAGAEEGVMPWASKTQNSISPAASPPVLEPFAAAVEAAAAATATATTGNPQVLPVAADASYRSRTNSAVPFKCSSEEDAEGAALSSICVPISPLPALQPASVTRAAAPARVAPITPLPAAAGLPPAVPDGKSFYARSPVAPPSGQPAPLRRNRTLRLFTNDGGSSNTGMGSVATLGKSAVTAANSGANASASPMVWTNALYDVPGQSDGDEDSDGSAAPSRLV